MRYISLFSGIEAASVAWGPLGWEPVAFSEIEPFPCAVLAERFPDVPNLGDVSKVDWSRYRGAVDLVVGGSPCQAFSVAGRRRGLVDERGRLMLEYVRAVREIHPNWLLWENVPGVLSQSNGDAFETLQRELADCGYSLAWRTLDAQFYRVAQRRRRVFLVGHLGEDAYPAAVLFERESLRWDSPSIKAKRKELARASGRGPRGGDVAGSAAWAIDGNVCDRNAKQNGSGVSDDVSPTLNTVDRHAVAYGDYGCLNPWAPQHDRVFAPDSVCQTLYAHGSGGADCGAVLDAQMPRTAICVSPFDPRATCAEEVSVTVKANGHAPAVMTQYGVEIAGTLTARADSSPCADRGQNVVCMASTQANAEIEREMCPTMAARQHKDPPVLFARDVPYGLSWRWPWIVRRLMPVECERLQGFPDGWTRIPYRGKSADECPDAPRYKALGNSMAVPVMRWIGERIAIAEKENTL